MTECSGQQFEFHGLVRRSVQEAFSGGSVTSDAGGLLLREVEAKFHFIERLSECFADHREPDRVEHSLVDLLKQPVFCNGCSWPCPRPLRDSRGMARHDQHS